MRNIMESVSAPLPAVSMDAKQKKSNNDLFDAAFNGSVRDIEAAVRSGAKINGKNEDGHTALMIAVKNEKIDAIRLLNNLGANLEIKCKKEGYTALMHAVNHINHSRPIVDSKIDEVDDASELNEGDEFFETSLDYKVFSIAERDDIVNSRDADDMMVLMLLESNEDKHYIDSKGRVCGRSALMVAIQYGKDAIAQKLIDIGASLNIVNNVGFTALTDAVNKKDHSSINFLMKQKGKLDINQMWDAVALAATNGFNETFLQLKSEIDKNPEKFTDGQLPLAISETLRQQTNARDFVLAREEENLAMHAANNPAPKMTSVQPAAVTKRSRAPEGADDESLRPVISQNPTAMERMGEAHYQNVQLPSP